ncbi:efflux RND transporter periplasmic adaptor subunit [Nitrosospira sp. Is2]|uniref:efflux RND transporter periplasmic adaptor subunit n=1 Tax=Nitrosospira sp. Is2 TaxID=3080532 RepID=UPI002955B8A4|nr:efflux RND transporter periplasmic adaptor subunit [Nitrosospira sp. Is2]WON74580.1 efflux RND transporter periplasmic adaptor subunit [Nitrosospira sp. Is2]
MMNKRQIILIVVVIAIGAVLGGLILTWDKAATPEATHGGHDKSDLSHAAHDNHDHGDEDEANSTNGPHPHHETKDKSAGDKSKSREPGKGPKGGKLFTRNGFGVEVTIFEKGIPPQFRLYLYENGKPLPPSGAHVTVTLSRLGAPAQVFNFKPEADYLLGDQVVEEPHSFDMVIAADHKGETFRWGYSQVEARAEISDEVLKSIGVEVRTAGPATIRPTLKLPGEIGFDEHTIVQVVPRMPGIVTAVYSHHGQQVKKGEVLAVIESQVLAEIRAQFLAARKRLGLAQVTFEREKQLWQEKISAKQDYLAAQQALTEAEIASDLALAKLRTIGFPPEAVHQRGELARYDIRAPISGLITAKAVAQGQVLKEDAEIFTIADISSVWAQITVYAKDLDVLRLGEKATIRSTAIDAEGEGTISYISALIGVQTRTATARVVLENEDGRWRPGMFITAEVAIEELQVPVAVSADGIQTLDDHTVVFGRYGQYFEARPLRLGRSDGQMVEVLNGFTAGERYAAKNSFAIKAELGKSGASHDH